MCENSIIKINHDDCTGCMMCGDICSKNAISFHIENGFWFPFVDEEKCINCSICLKKCPVSPEYNKGNTNGALASFGVKTKDETIRYQSTSGGFFTELAMAWMKNGGKTCGAIYAENQEIKHYLSSNIYDLEKLRQSKYAQSWTSGIYKTIKEKLSKGDKILFCGTPCQVAALKSMLGKDYSNLLTMDFICLGICSPIVYRRYLEMIERRYHSKIKQIWFKHKKNGWRSVSTYIKLENGQEYLRSCGYDMYMLSFITDAISIRNSCDTCKFRNLNHISDFTVGDFWGIEKINPEKDDNMGLSALFINSEKGLYWFNSIKDRLVSFETTPNDVIAGNFSVLSPKKPSPQREAFLEYIMNHSFKRSMIKYSSIGGILGYLLNELKCLIIIFKKNGELYINEKYGKNFFN